MRWKIVFATFFFVALAAAAGVGFFKFQTIQKGNSLAKDLEVCKNQIAMGNHERAQVNLKRILDENPRMEHADGVWAMLADSFKATGANDQALACYEKIQQLYPDSSYVPQALSAVAEKLMRENKPAEAQKLWDQILTQHKGSDATSGALFGKAQVLFDSGETEAARAALNQILEQYPNTNKKDDIEALLGKINLDALYSRSTDEAQGDQIYQIARGDKLEGIARRNKVSPELIAKANNIRDVRGLRVGRRLRIPKTNFTIVVDKGNNSLTLLNNGKFFKKYSVRTGKEKWLTPPGDFRVLTKVKNPPWSNPLNGQHYGANDPNNELGTRWMAFELSAGLGIHGTIHPETVGKYASNGCVGMHMADVEELYDLVPIGTPIKIIGKMAETKSDKDLKRAEAAKGAPQKETPAAVKPPASAPATSAPAASAPAVSTPAVNTPAGTPVASAPAKAAAAPASEADALPDLETSSDSQSAAPTVSAQP